MKKIIFSFAVSIAALAAASSALAGTQYVRVVWDSDPATNAVIGFSPSGTSNNRYIKFGSSTNESNWTTIGTTIQRTFKSSLQSNFVRLSGLNPNTNYYFRACDHSGCGDRYYFRTASDSAQAMTFISGGDSRTNRSPRQQGNRLVAKVRPHFIAFSGDFTDNHTVTQWHEWLEDWELTYSSSTINGVAYKQVHPIIPTTGNHESSDLLFICSIFGVDSNGDGNCTLRDAYNAFNIGDNLIRMYSLSTEFGSSAYANERAEQLDWLEDDLADNYSDTTWSIGQYHKPMFPRTSSKTGSAVSRAWASLFYDYSMNLVIESDTHLVKYTRPVQPLGTTDYIEASAGTVYIGEGAWGAPLRTANVQSDWILDQSSFYHFMVVQVTPTQMDVRTVKFSGESSTDSLSRTLRESDPLALPSGLSLWDAAFVGEVLSLVQDSNGRSALDGVDQGTTVLLSTTRDVSVGSGDYYTDGSNLEADGNDAGQELRVLLGWNTSSIPAATDIDSASLRLNISNRSTGQYRIYEAATSWTENNANWAKADNFGVQMGSFSPSSTGTLNVTLNSAGTNIVQEWVNGTRPNNGVVLVSAGTTDGVDLSSRESGNAPRLIVNY